jgi:ABC-2 type transport system permease protein
MSKIALIIQREFLSRVTKKSFLLTTLLVPLIFPAIFATIIYFIEREESSSETQTILVLDETNSFDFTDDERFTYTPINGTLDQAKTAFQEGDDYALLYIPEYDMENPSGFAMYARSATSLKVSSIINRKVEEMVRQKKLNTYDIDQAMLDRLKTNIDVTTYDISQGQEKESNQNVSFGIGYITGFLIYMFMFAYGGQVMQGVIEEKSNKIVEVIISTVKPFQLMMGKILGVASVGLFQVVIWIVLMTTVFTVVLAMFGVDMSENMMQARNVSENDAQQILATLSQIPFTRIILTFIFYFLGGYLLYGALFAAVGSAVDTPSEAQQFMFPIMIPLIAGIIGMTSIVNNPEGNVSFWLSIIPFTSPIAMMGRIGYGVPAWELALSMVLLILGFLGTTWLAGRIYRIGILMHGSKVNYKVLAKWIRMK